MSVENLLPMLPLAGAGLGLLGVRPVVRLLARSHESTHLTDELPWSHLDEDGETVWLTRGGAFRVVELGGAVDVGQKIAAIRAALAQRESYWLGQQHRPVRHRIIRKREPVPMPPPTDQPGFLGRLDRAWHNQVRESYHTTHFVILSVEKNDEIGRLDSVWADIKMLLSDYQPRRLVNEASEELGGCSPLLSFLAWLVTDRPAYVRPTNRLHEAVSVASMHFEPDGRVIVDDGTGRRRVQVLGVRAWPEETTGEVLRRVFRLPYQVSSMLHVATTPAAKAKGKVERQWKQINALEDVGKKDGPAKGFDRLGLVNEEWKETVQALMADKTALHQVELFLYINTPEAEAEEAYSRVTEILGSKGLQVIREGGLANRAYWARLPGYDYFTRGYPNFWSENVAELTPFDAEPIGRHGCYWGPRPLRYVPTAGARSPYGFTTQTSEAVQANGHMAIFGGSSRGKTTIFGFLLAGAMSSYPDLRALAFDKDNGFRVLTEALAGQYLVPGGGRLPLNPFMTDAAHTDDVERVISMLANVDPDDDAAVKAVARGVRAIMALPMKDRILAEELGGCFPAGPVRSALETWCDRSRYGEVFNGTEDAFAPGAARLSTVAMDGMDNDPRLAAALSYYFSRRTTAELAGTPHVILITEGGQLLSIDGLALQARDLLRTVRKNDGAVWLEFQEASALERLPHGLGPAIHASVDTMLFFPGTASSRDELDKFKWSWTEAEAAFVLGEERPFSAAYPVLLKRENESAFLDFDISGIGDLLKVFRGGSRSALALADARKEMGDQWLDAYLRQ